MFLKVSKQVLNLFWDIFLEKKCPVQCTLEGRNLVKIQKIGKTSNCSKWPKKRSQKQSNTFSTCFEVFIWQKFLPSAPWVVETRKKYKKWKNFETYKNLQKRSQKHCLSMFCLIISTEKSSAQWTLETQKNPQEAKRLQNFKIPKNVIRSVQTCLR